jgi:hypothetical protein
MCKPRLLFLLWKEESAWYLGGFYRLHLNGCGLRLDRFGFIGLGLAAAIAQDLGEFSGEQGDDDSIVNLTDEGNKVRCNVNGAEQIDQGSSNHPPAIFRVGNEIAIPVVERFEGKGGHGFLGFRRGAVRFAYKVIFAKAPSNFEGFPCG